MSSDCNGLIGGMEKKQSSTKKYCSIIEKVIKKLKPITAPFGLLTALMIYTALGGLIFRHLELQSEIRRLEELRAEVLVRRNRLFKVIVDNGKADDLATLIERELRIYEKSVEEATQGGFLITSLDEPLRKVNMSDLPPVVTERWSKLQAIFFASTVLTTIGYGNVVPSTHWGRVFCIFYAFIGIPLTLTAIAAWGKLFAETVSKLGNQLRSRFSPWLSFLIPSNITGKRSLGAFAAVFLLFIYLSCGAAIFMLWEDWDFFNGFYFWFVTMTTIGFGDLVPKRPKYMLLCSLYILVGLALTSTIIELVRMQYNQSWRRLQSLRGPLTEALKKLGEQAGGDMSALQMDLKKVLAVVSLPKFKRKSGKDTQRTEWEEAVQAVLKGIEASTPKKQNIVRIVIYESSV